MNSATTIIQNIEPQYIDSIRTLFEGNMVNSDIFYRTIQTYIPKKYQITAEDKEQLAKSIMQLFEELDSDTDGLITWQEFYSYYAQSTNNLQENLPTLKPTQTVFKQIQGNSDKQSGKTGKVLVDSYIDNYNEVADLGGTKIIHLEQIGDQFYVTTDQQFLVYDSMFLFPKVLFTPSLSLIQQNNQTRRKPEYDDRDEQLLLKTAYNDLTSMGIDHPEYHKDPRKSTIEKLQNKLQVSPTVTNCKTIVCNCYLHPLPIFAICTEYPGIFFVNMNGQTSDYFELESKAISLLYDSETSVLYIGHQTGKVIKYSVNLVKKKLQELKLEELNMTDEQRSMRAFNEVMKQKSLPFTKEGLLKLTKPDWIKIYPQLQTVLFDFVGDAQERSRNQISKRQQLTKEVAKIMNLKYEDLEVVGLLSDIIFKTKVSVCSNNNINLLSMIRQDPIAYLKVKSQPVKLPIKEQKQGVVKLQILFDKLKEHFTTSGPVRCMSMGRGTWESQISQQRNLRIVVASQDGSLMILNEELNEVASFPSLHPDGLVSIHVVDDYITSVGYNDIYLIDNQVVQAAHQGFQIIKQDDRVAMKQMEEEEMLQGNLVKSVAQIRLLKPPKPGQPVIHSLQMGNVICVIDHQNVVTMFHAVTGAHITRTACNFPNSALARFGHGCYNQMKDIGFIPVGKMVFYVKAVSNEDIKDDNAVLDILQLQYQQENQQRSSDLHTIPIGSANKSIVSYCVNQVQNEIAAVSGDLEITFYSLATGRPIRSVDMNVFMEDYISQYQLTDYDAIETNDTLQFYSETRLPTFRSKSLPSNASRQKVQIRQNFRKSEKKLSAQLSILDILGNKILGISINAKGRVLYVFGEKGTATLYWTSCQLFDMNNTGVKGQKSEQYKEANVVNNPFNIKRSVLDKQIKVQDNKIIEGDMSTFSLNLNFDYVLENKHVKIINAKQRVFLVLSDKLNNKVYINDSLNSQCIYQICTQIDKNFTDKPINTRISQIFQLENLTKEIDFIGQQQSKLYNYFSQSSTFTGQIENNYGLEKVGQFVPKILQNQQKKEKYPQTTNQIQKLIQSLIQRQQIPQFQVVCMTSSIQLGLTAYGCSNGCVYIYDSQTNMLPKGTIQIPYVLQKQTITSLVFTNEYPLLIVGCSTGDIFVYTCRPFKPNTQIVLAFRHATYCPINIPLNVDYVQINNNYASITKFITQFAMHNSKKYSVIRRKQEDVIKYIIFKYQMDLKNSIYIPDNSISSYLEKYLLYISGQLSDSQMEADHSQNSNTIFDNANTSPSQLNVLHKNKYIEGDRHMVIVNDDQQIIQQKQTTKEELSQQFDYSDEFEVLKEFLGKLSYQKSNTISKKTSQIFGQSMPHQNNMTVDQAKIYNRKKKTLAKIHAGVHLLEVFSSLQLNLLNNQVNNLFIQDMDAPQKEMNTSEEEEEKLSKLPILKQKELQKDKMLLRTNYYLHIRAKQSYRAKKQDSESTVFVFPDEGDYSGHSGFVSKTVHEEMRQRRVLVRVQDLKLLKNQVAPTAMFFDSFTQTLIIGTDNGFLSKYNFQKLFEAIKIMPVSKKVNVIKTEYGENIIDDGFQDQYLDYEQNKQLNLSLQPLYKSTIIQCEYIFRAHTSQIVNIERLIGTNNILTLGQDRRILCFDFTDGSLQGSIQRVSLPQPTETIQNYYSQSIYNLNTYQVQVKNTSKESTKSNKPNLLNLADLCKQINEYTIPFLRLEYPPACQYKWNHVSRVECLNQHQLKQNDIVQSCLMESEQPLGDTVKNVKPLHPVPTYLDSEANTLLKTTGLTPQRLARHRDTWTIRAILNRASNNQIQDSQNASEVMSQFKTQPINQSQKRDFLQNTNKGGNE